MYSLTKGLCKYLQWKVVIAETEQNKAVNYHTLVLNRILSLDTSSQKETIRISFLSFTNSDTETTYFSCFFIYFKMSCSLQVESKESVYHLYMCCFPILSLNHNIFIPSVLTECQLCNSDLNSFASMKFTWPLSIITYMVVATSIKIPNF